MDDIEAIVPHMGKLEDMGLADEVLRLFHEAEKLVLRCRDLSGDRVYQGLDAVVRYVNRHLDQFVEAGIINHQERDDQYTKGFFYLQYVGGTGKTP